MERSWFNSRQWKNVMWVSHWWKAFPRLEPPVCEADNPPSYSKEVSLHAFKVCKGTILPLPLGRKAVAIQTKTITCTVSRIFAALYFNEDSPYLQVSQLYQSRSNKTNRKLFKKRHSVIVDISQCHGLLSKVSLRSVTL